MTHRPNVFLLKGLCCALVLAFSLAALSGCGDTEPEERRAFIAYLNDTILAQKGVELPELSPAEKKSIGAYKKHYELLTGFQKTLAKETRKNTGELLALFNTEDVTALAERERSLKKAVRETEKLRKIILSLLEKTDKAKTKLAMPDDLAAVYNPVYAKVVSLPAASSAAVFDVARSAFAANLDLLDFIGSNSRDVEISGGTINLKNPGLKDELDGKASAVRDRTLALQRALAEMVKTMQQ